MPFGEVRLIPGVNVERTATLNEAGYAASSLIRFKDGLAQKIGGFAKFYPFAVSGVPRDLHAWEDLNQTNHLAVATTTQLAVITSGALADISPQTVTSDFTPFVQATANSTTIVITDANISNVTAYDAVIFNTPVSAGGAVLSGGPYAITQSDGTHSYEIKATSAAANTNTLTTNNTTAAGNATLHFASVPSWVVAGMIVADLTSSAVIPANTVVSSTTATTIVMSANAAGAGVGNGDSIVITSLPRFTAASGSAIVAVELVAHGLSTTLANTVNFPIATTGDGVTISGTYTVPATQVTDANNFNITVSNQANASSSFNMNSGNAEIVYYIQLGPPAIGSGYGLGTYGGGGYGTGSSTSSQTGTDLASKDWTTDNWGQVLLSCPVNGAVFQFDPTSGFATSGLVATAPPINGGIFVSTTQQILVCWGSTAQNTIGISQDPLLVKWSTILDYTTFTPLPSNSAGSYRISVGSTIRAGLAVGNQNLIWTDLDVWAMNFIGGQLVYGFNKIGAGAGAISSHAVQQLRGGVYWMGPSNFYAMGSDGVKVIPCPVWDFVFQNLNSSTDGSRAYVNNVRAMPNTPFNEVGWLFPSSASANGECDSYVKFNITEPNAPWDYGPANSLPRSAWIDQTVLGNPIGASPTGIVYQHETTNDADGAPLSSSFTTGYFYIAEGQDFAFVDQIIPDFKWGFFGGSQTAQVQLTFNVVDQPSDTPTVYGPYLVTQSTQFISVGFRGRQVSITVSSSDTGSFWRIGKIRYRWAASGRR